MSIVILILAILVILGMFQSGSKNTSVNNTSNRTQKSATITKHRNSPKRGYKNIGTYVKEELVFNVKGIWAEKDRIEAFRKLDDLDVLFLEFESNNEYDENALAVKTESGRMIGYIERNQRKLIKTINQNPNNIATINEKSEFFSEYHKRVVYRLSITVFVGFDKFFVEDKIKNIKQFKLLKQRNNEVKSWLKRFNERYKELKKSAAKSDLENIEQLCTEIVAFNEVSEGTFKIIALPLDKLTIITNYNKEYRKTVEYAEKFLDKYPFTENQIEKIQNRVKLALSKIDE